MTDELKMLAASFALREGREPTAEELEVLKEAQVADFEKSTQSGCMINYN